ncbi:rhodanese-like domain-containing protein [Paenibacillus sp.]|uniref:rhodanese-like domain-containing protein n=1 Tax=Paenibacillus sp. TaxID=58172 RepID=UPI002D570238|nr:rhodanese-like domain-containing protein [Paenibacillus sp.]HZG55446.1 rhodanese-like domain-containing protein [Paenibacillus sp.]
MNEYAHITPGEFLRKYDRGELKNGLVLDVREPFEWDYYHLENTKLMPLQSIPASLGELPRDRTIYIVCAHGVRSEYACRYLAAQGYEDLVNVLGGMAAIAAERGFAYD